MASSEAVTVDAGGRDVRVSSADRVIFAETERSAAVTKLDVVEDYLAVGDGIMRALGRRPTTLERWPKGVDPGIVLSTREKGGGDAFFRSASRREPRTTCRLPGSSFRRVATRTRSVPPRRPSSPGRPRWARSPSIRGRFATTTSTTPTSCVWTWTRSRARTSTTPCASRPRHARSCTTSAIPASRRPREAGECTSTSGSSRAGLSRTSVTPPSRSGVSSSAACRDR